MHTSRSVLAAATASLPLLAGCLFEAQKVQTLYSAKIDNNRSIALRSHSVTNALSSGPRFNFCELQFTGYEGECTSDSTSFGRRPNSGNGGYSSTLTKLEGRTDDSCSRVWIIDRDSNQVIVAYDIASGRIFPMDDAMPDWAQPDAGTSLALAPPVEYSTQTIVGMGFGVRR